MALIDIRIGLLLQNARQMLDILRGTFPALSFSEVKLQDDCTLAPSAGDTLSCLWSNAASIVDAPGQIDTVAALHALTQVSDRVGLHLSLRLLKDRSSLDTPKIS